MERSVDSSAEDPSTGNAGRYDLVIVGGTAAGLSVAISSKRSGIDHVRIVEPRPRVAFPQLVPDNLLDVGFGESVVSIELATEAAGDGGGANNLHDLIVTTNLRGYRTTGCFVAQRVPHPDWTPPIPIAASDRVHIDVLPENVDEQDVLVIGHTDNAIEQLVKATDLGARVVYAAGGLDPGKLSPAGAHILRQLERDRRVTVLYRSVPVEIGDANGFPIAYFDDRRMPDLEFDHVLFASSRFQPKTVRDGISDAALATGRIIFLGLPHEDPTVQSAQGWNAGNIVAEACFPDLEVPRAPVLKQRARHEGAVEELRKDHYNATITAFEPTHSDLWVLRVKPDQGDTDYQPGQYASLGLGFWERRVDNAIDDNLDERWTKLIRRSYSISHPIFDEHGYLAETNADNELEFYIVLVAPTEDNTPALTPRLAMKQVGDRIYLGPKVAGRYTLAPVQDPTVTALFLSTGTGEAPHNAMITQLLRKGHTGPIISAVTVRKWADLGYLEQHRELEARYPNYHYLPLPTREADVPKRYLQDLLRDGDIDTAAGGALDATTSHAFLCGNPAMIGLPEEEDGELRYPEPTGVVELLAERGFTLDRRGEPGNIHFEEYW